MKKLILLLTALGTQVGLAQNTFPATGNVGLGVANPMFKLDVLGGAHFKVPDDQSGLGGLTIDTNNGTTLKMGGNFTYSWIQSHMSLPLYINELGNNTIINLSYGNVGIGTQSPTAKLDVRGTIKSYEPTALGASINSSQLINQSGASCGTTTGNKLYNRLWMFRDNASSTDWLTSRLHDGISIDFSFGAPQVDTKTWWERDPYDNIQSWGNAAETYVTINKGNVGIGTTSPDSKLTVKGDIHSREVKVTVDAGADFVFAEDYALPTLDSVENYIKENKHLPEIASAAEMKKDGINLSEMNIKLLQKVEELTLYMIEQNKKMELQQKENAMQSKQIEEQNNKIFTLQEKMNNIK